MRGETHFQTPGAITLKSKRGESDLYLKKNKRINQISPPEARNDKLMSFSQRVRYKPCGRKALAVQATAALDRRKHLELVKKGQIKQILYSRSSGCRRCMDPECPADTTKGQRWKAAVRRRWVPHGLWMGRKTEKARNTPAPDASPTHEIKLALRLNSKVETVLWRFRRVWFQHKLSTQLRAVVWPLLKSSILSQHFTFPIFHQMFPKSIHYINIFFKTVFFLLKKKLVN